MHASNEMAMGRMWGAVAVVVALALGSAACGGNSKADDTAGGPSSGADDVTTAGGENPSTRSDADDKGARAAGDDAKAAGAKAADMGASTGTTASIPGLGTTTTTHPTNSLVRPGPKGQLTMKATLEETCVRPGGKQSITIETQPGSGVGYDTKYADGKTGMMEGHYGGNKGGSVDESGRWSDIWVVAPTAPAGSVQVNVLGSHIDYGSAQETLYFVVAGPTGTCG